MEYGIDDILDDRKLCRQFDNNCGGVSASAARPEFKDHTHKNKSNIYSISTDKLDFTQHTH